MADKELTLSEVAKQLGVAPVTVRGWLRRDATRELLPDAKLISTPRGDVWLVPESNVKALIGKPLPKSGPKPKAKPKSDANGKPAKKLSAKKGSK